MQRTLVQNLVVRKRISFIFYRVWDGRVGGGKFPSGRGEIISEIAKSNKKVGKKVCGSSKIALLPAQI